MRHYHSHRQPISFCFAPGQQWKTFYILSAVTHSHECHLLHICFFFLKLFIIINHVFFGTSLNFNNTEILPKFSVDSCSNLSGCTLYICHFILLANYLWTQEFCKGEDGKLRIVRQEQHNGSKNFAVVTCDIANPSSGFYLCHSQ